MAGRAQTRAATDGAQWIGVKYSKMNTTTPALLRSAPLRAAPFSPFGMHATLDSAMCPQIQISQQYLTTSCHADQKCAQTKKKKKKTS